MNRELDAQIAQQVMGFVWVENYYGTCKWLAPAFDENGMVLADGTTGPCIDADREVPAYSTDLNACAEAEAQVVELGHTEAYGAALWAEHFGPVPMFANSALLCALATAPAEARCRAMLRVIGENKS